MGYYHIKLTQNLSDLCTVVLLWGKYEYLKLPMGLCNSPDIFQEKMGDLFADLETVRAYIDDLLVITKGNWYDHLAMLETVLRRLLEAGLKVNVNKSFFSKHELQYLGYWISRQGIQPLKSKVDAILKIAPPTNTKELRRFLGMINFYRDMWKHRPDTLAPLTALTSSTSKWEWTESHQKAFDKTKTMLYYNDNLY